MDQAPAYQIAVVADDHEMGVTEVVRGDDLVPSTFRQLALYQFFGWTPPQFAHLPLVVGPDGRRLAKRHGDTRLSWLRERGLRPETLVGWLACQSGLIDHCEPVAACELISQFKWSRLPLQQPVFSAVHAETLLANQRRPPMD
jgi:glutamyl-tRNA synthetase